MPELYDSPGAIPSSSMPADLLAACKSVIEGDPEIGVGGTLGVVTTELLWDQTTKERKRPFGSNELPAIALWLDIGDVSAALSGVNQMLYHVHFQVTTRSGNHQTGRAANLAIQARLLMLLALQRRNVSFLAENFQSNCEVTPATGGDPQLQSADVFVGEGSIDFGILYWEVF